MIKTVQGDVCRLIVARAMTSCSGVRLLATALCLSSQRHCLLIQSEIKSLLNRLTSIGEKCLSGNALPWPETARGVRVS